MKYIYLMAAVCLLVNLSACKSAREIRLYEEYPAKTELPVILKTSKEIYEGQYVYFGRIEISSTDEMRALETAAKYGADGVGLVSIGMVKDAYSYEHRKVQEADGSWSIETTTYKTPNAYYVDGIGISLYRHDPSQDRYTRWFRNCYDIRREISSYKPVCDNETLSYLLSKGVDPNIQDLNGKTALYNVVKSIRTQTQKQSASEGCTPYIQAKMLLDADADPNILPHWNVMKSSGTVAKDYKQPTHIEYLHKLYKGNDEIVYFDRECVSNLIELLRSKGAK